MWNVKRRQQITDLEDLLRGIAMLDRSTGAITDLPKLIKKAQDLLAADYSEIDGVSDNYKSFTQYITDEALK